MAGNTYVTKGYTQYNHITTRQGDYDHGQQNPIINKNVAETKTNKWARASASGYPYLSGTPTKFELLWEYVYAPNMASRNEDYGPNYGLNYENSTPNKHLLSPALSYSTQDPKKVHSSLTFAGVRDSETGNISGPNKSWQSAGSPATHRPLWHSETGNISGPNKSWQSGSPATHRPLTESINNTGKALGHDEEYVNQSSGLDLRRTRRLEAQSQYERLYFRGKQANNQNSANTRTTY